jgi:peroxiredoxin
LINNLNQTKLKKSAFILLLIGSILSNCTQHITGTYTLEGRIEGYNSGKIILRQETAPDIIHSDTAKVMNGEFVFKGSLKEPGLALLQVDNESTDFFYLEPNEMKIKLSKGKFMEAKLTGSKTQDEKEQFYQQGASIGKKIHDYLVTARVLEDSLKKTEDKAVNENLEKREAVLSDSIDQLRKQKQLIEEHFIRTHPNSYVAPFLLYYHAVNETMPIDTLKMIFNNLALPVQQSIKGTEIQQIMKKRINNSFGCVAPDFRFPDKTNQMRSLSEFKGKCILIDVWASWCIPCRGEIPHLQDIFRKYNSGGLEIIALSKDKDRNKWEKAIVEDHTENWLHGILAPGNEQITETDFYKNYHFQAIPHVFLIDKNGKIAGNWVGASKENELAMEVALKEIFK